MLDGINVLDLSRAIAGPYCTMLLGDFGATITKVEPPNGDMARFAGLSRVGEERTYFLAMNRNKRSIVIDLRSAHGREVMEDLVRRADVLVENFRPGVLDRLGFGSERLAELNESLIVCAISGYGQTSPYRDRKALDLIGQTMSGFASLTGSAGGPPTPGGAPVSDILTGLNACIGILTALVGRERRSDPQPISVDVSLVASTLSMMSVEATSYLNTGRVPGRHGGAWFEMFPYDVFPTSNGWIAIGAGRDWRGLCEILDLPALAEREEEFSDMATRLQHRPELKAQMSEATRRQTTDHWLRVLQEADILSGPVYALDEVMADASVRHAGLEIEMEHPTAGLVKTIDSAPSFTIGMPGGGTWEKRRNAPPLLGQHTLEILAELGYTDDRIDELCSSGSVAFLP